MRSSFTSACASRVSPGCMSGRQMLAAAQTPIAARQFTSAPQCASLRRVQMTRNSCLGVVQRSPIKSRSAMTMPKAKKDDGDSEDANNSSTSDPKACREAIDLGLELYQQAKFAEAIEMWQKSLELPGSGAMRLSGTVREFSCPSTGEENSALYNMACAYAQLKQEQSALTCIQGVLDNGFDDFEVLRTDPDLKAVQSPELEAMIAKFETPVDKITRVLGMKKAKSSGTNKPWLIW